MKAYPYRQKNGYRSILEAVDRNDARQYLKACSGRGVRFCEIEIDLIKLQEIWFSPDKDQIVDLLLANHRNFVT